jgi:hypothetical protein|tara:strand:- start:169 stop:300 length:132 start_codon:yes stop_codon:yes gene_type:complete
MIKEPKDRYKAEEALGMIFVALFGAAVIGIIGAIVVLIKSLFQ